MLANISFAANSCLLDAVTFELCQQTVLFGSQRQAVEFLPSQLPLLNVYVSVKTTSCQCFR